VKDDGGGDVVDALSLRKCRLLRGLKRGSVCVLAHPKIFPSSFHARRNLGFVVAAVADTLEVGGVLRRWYAPGNSSLPGAGRAWSTPSGRRSMCGRWVGSHCFNRYLPHLVTCSPLIPLFGSEAEPVGICPERKDARRRRKFRPRRGGDPFFGRGEESPAPPADDSGRGTAAGRDTLFHREEPGEIDLPPGSRERLKVRDTLLCVHGPASKVAGSTRESCWRWDGAYPLAW